MRCDGVADPGTRGSQPCHGLQAALACGAGDDPHRGHRRSQAEDVIWIGCHDYGAAMHGRYGHRMRINDVLGSRARTMKDGPNAASEVKVCRNDPDRGPRSAGLAMPRQ
jgi:hypothetical protein